MRSNYCTVERAASRIPALLCWIGRACQGVGPAWASRDKYALITHAVDRPPREGSLSQSILSSGSAMGVQRGPWLVQVFQCPHVQTHSEYRFGRMSSQS